MMRSWLPERFSRPLIGALVGTAVSALLVAGGVLWVDQHRALELRLAFAQAETSRLAGLLNALVARVDQAVIGLTLAPGLVDDPACDQRITRTAETLPDAVSGFALVDAGGIVTCSSIPALRGRRSVAAAPLQAEIGAAPLVSFIIAGSESQNPVIIIQRPLMGDGIVAAGLRVEGLRLVANTRLAAALEDSRGTRVALSDGRITRVPPATYFPPGPTPMTVTLPEGRRVVARISDHLAVTLDVTDGTPADARAAALASTRWVFLVLAIGLAVILLVLRFTVLRPMRRLGEQLAATSGPGGLTDWLTAHPASPMRDMAARIIARELSQEQRLALRNSLLREVNHRVAGHLQMVTSLLRLQGREDAPEAVAAALRLAEHRVNTLALVHQGLQQALHGERLELLDLLRRVAVHLVEGSPVAGEIDLQVEGQKLTVPPEIGVPVALILNEWMSTALRQSSPPVTIVATLWRHGAGAALEYRDGGQDEPARTGLSPTIVGALSEQIGGHCERLPGQGWRLVFPLQPHGDA